MCTLNPQLTKSAESARPRPPYSIRRYPSAKTLKNWMKETPRWPMFKSEVKNRETSGSEQENLQNLLCLHTFFREFQISLSKGKWYNFCFYDYQTIEVHMSTLIKITKQKNKTDVVVAVIYVLVEFARVTKFFHHPSVVILWKKNSVWK